MADQRAGNCNIDISMNDPEKCASECSEKSNVFRRLNKIPKLKLILGKFATDVWQLGKDDPRRVIHAIKVGLALSVVSLFYLMDPLFKGLGDNAIWAIMTVVVVFEFTAGATLSKGMNRGIGTVLAGSFGVLVGIVADIFEPKGEAIVIGVSCFIFGAAATYCRFFPKIKRKYDYGVLIFLLTFNMIAVSGYRFDNGFHVGYERVSTIGIGFAICIMISLLVYPIWAGEDLHQSIVKKIEGLSITIEGCVVEYFKGSRALEADEIPEDAFCKGYRDVLDSKTSEESLATFASWEPRHGKFRFNHPWRQYVQVGVMLRHLAYSVAALHACLRSEIQAPRINLAAFEKPFTKVGYQVAQLLKLLAESLRCMKQCPPSQTLMESLHDAVEELNTAFRLQPKLFHSTQQFYSTYQNHSTVETMNPNENPPNIEANPDHEPIQIIKDAEQNHISDQDEHNSSTELPSKELDSSSKTQDLDGERKYTPSTSCRSYMKGTSGVEFADALPLAAFGFLLIELVARLEHVIEAVHQLGKLAAFEPYDCTEFVAVGNLEVV